MRTFGLENFFWNIAVLLDWIAVISTHDWRVSRIIKAARRSVIFKYRKALFVLKIFLIKFNKILMY
jgi:hypothetical protein